MEGRCDWMNFAKSKFYRYFILNLTIVFFFVLGVLPFGIMYYRSMEQDAFDERQSALTDSVVALDVQLRTLEAILIRLTDNDSVNSLAHASQPLAPRDHLKLAQAHKYVKTIANSNSMIAELVIVLSKSACALTGRAAFPTQGLFERYYSFSDPSLQKAMGAPPSVELGFSYLPGSLIGAYNDATIRKAAFCYVLPVNVENSLGYAYLYVDQQQIENLFSAVVNHFGCSG
jgi:hypothetical protein